MKKRESKIARAAHIKSNTHGTSNEISFSVLDAAKQSLDGGKSTPSIKAPSLGIISLFTLGLRKKPPATPVKEQGIMLPSGEFVSTEGGSSSTPLLPSVTSSVTLGEGSSAVDTSSLTEAGGKAASVSDGTSGGIVGLASSLAPASAAASAASSKDVSAGAWAAPYDEVAKRKATRKRRKAFVAFVLSAACIAAVVAVGLTVYGSVQAQQDARSRLVGNIEAIEKADEAVLELDEMVVACINDGWESLPSDASAEYQRVKADLSDSAVMLADAAANIEAIQPSLEDPYDQEAASQALVAVRTRLAMIESGCAIVEHAVLANNAFDHAEEAWISLVEGDSLAREAASLASDTSKETVALSMQKSNEALAAFSEVLPCLAAAESEMEGLDFSEYECYVELRIEATKHALLSDQAYLDRNKEKAAAENDQYNQLDAEAAALAQQIGSEPAEMVAAIVDAGIEDEVDAYADARSHASIADTSLREYLSK